MSMRKNLGADQEQPRTGAIKRVVSIDGLLFSFVTMKPWKAEEEKPPFFVTTRCGKTCTTETSKYHIAHATFEALEAPSVSAPLRC